MKTTSSNHQENRRKTIDLLRYRKQAYLHTFSPEDNLSQAVLTDLARFCRADKSTFDPNQAVQARLDGRREVWLRIANHLNMTETELYEIFALGKG